MFIVANFMANPNAGRAGQLGVITLENMTQQDSR